MRAITVALLVGFLVALGAAPVAAAARVPKVALIVGPVGPEITPRYKALADAAAAVARDAGAQVVKVYSPNATWPAVKQAISGASIVVYLGHGNGWPSRYRDGLFPPSQNGFGLNPVAGGDDSSHQYFGEASVDDVRLAKNAVVLLHHLCYASGNTEPGLPEGSLDQAVQRVDNYASGFLRAGARAVVAEAHLGPAWYVRKLLTTRSSIEAIWSRSPNAKGHTMRFASERSPGYTARLDPDNRQSGFHRSLVSRGVTAADLRANATGTTSGVGGAVVGPPPEPSLVGASLKFDELAFGTLPIAATKTKVSLPLAGGSMKSIPKGVQVGLRWDPILLDPPAPEPTGAGQPAASPLPEPETPASPPPSAEPAATPTPDAQPSIGVPTEAPAVDLVVPERTGSVVDLTDAARGKDRLTVAVSYPKQPGLYRLVPTLHTPAGVAYDAPTQAMLTPVLVRVGGAVAVAYGAPASLTLLQGTEATVPVRIVNAGSEAWDQLVTAPQTSVAGEALPDDHRSRVPARLVATWVSSSDASLPSATSVLLDPAVSVPGGEVAVGVELIAPAVPGEYLLLLDVVSPSLGPLSAAGSAPALVRVTVLEPPIPTPAPPRRD